MTKFKVAAAAAALVAAAADIYGIKEKRKYAKEVKTVATAATLISATATAYLCFDEI